MSTRVIQPAKTVRTKFEQLSATRTEKLVDMAIAKADQKLTAYFEERLNAGLDPYPAPDHSVTLTILEAADFASGNDPEAQGAWEQLSKETPDGLLVIKRLHEELKGAGFDAVVRIDQSRDIKVTVSDPQFTRWFNDGHDVDVVAAEEARRKFLTERAAPVLALLEADVKKTLRETLEKLSETTTHSGAYGGLGGRIQGNARLYMSSAKWNEPRVADDVLRFALDTVLEKLGAKSWTRVDISYSTIEMKFEVRGKSALDERIKSLD